MAIITLLLISCSDKNTTTEVLNHFAEKVIGNNEGVFRGLNLGDNLNKVQKSEEAQLLEADSAYLYYEYFLDDSIGSYNITYNFDEKGLYEIQSSIFINDADQTENVINQFKSYFDKFYGTSVSEMGFNVWSVKSEKFGQVKINLRDESANYTVEGAPGKISLWIYKEEANS
ncbi:MAG: hypothetical protein WBM13_13585 [Bacteroidia bacterium]